MRTLLGCAPDEPKPEPFVVHTGGATTAPTGTLVHTVGPWPRTYPTTAVNTAVTVTWRPAG